ncbi:MAG TPA: redoxin family protein [Oscillospiraceae bacterium]|nr:redoxin family protein [Oscillospiraceae bacterium]HPS75993.1 redoxin family protein [Oscillospiraceae bacterium]
MKKRLTAFLVLSLALFSACGSGAAVSQSSAAPAEVKTITPEAAKARLDSGDALVLLDVRTAEEYAEAHIDGAVLLPSEDIGDTAPALLPVKDAEIIVCGGGQDGGEAAQKLANLGYTNVSDLGDLQNWTYGTVSGAWAEKTGAFSSFRTSTLEGKVVDESLFAGHKLTMVNVWATFCGPCLNEMPELGKLAADNAANGVQIVGLVVDAMGTDGSVSQSQVELARQLVEKTGAAYTHLLPDAGLLSGALSGVTAVPTTFFVDETGTPVGDAYEGARSAEQWQAIIDSLTA